VHARYYLALLGRFLSRDPQRGSAERPQSWNGYSYASNRPIVSLDRDGRADSVVFTDKKRAYEQAVAKQRQQQRVQRLRDMAFNDPFWEGNGLNPEGRRTRAQLARTKADGIRAVPGPLAFLATAGARWYVGAMHAALDAAGEALATPPAPSVEPWGQNSDNSPPGIFWSYEGKDGPLTDPEWGTIVDAISKRRGNIAFEPFTPDDIEFLRSIEGRDPGNSDDDFLRSLGISPDHPPQ